MWKHSEVYERAILEREGDRARNIEIERSRERDSEIEPCRPTWKPKPPPRPGFPMPWRLHVLGIQVADNIGHFGLGFGVWGLWLMTFNIRLVASSQISPSSHPFLSLVQCTTKSSWSVIDRSRAGTVFAWKGALKGSCIFKALIGFKVLSWYSFILATEPRNTNAQAVNYKTQNVKNTIAEHPYPRPQAFCSPIYRAMYVCIYTLCM